MPLDALEVLDVVDDELVARDDDVEGRVAPRVRLLLAPELTQHAPVLRVAPVRHHLRVHRPNIV